MMLRTIILGLAGIVSTSLTFAAAPVPKIAKVKTL